MHRSMRICPCVSILNGALREQHRSMADALPPRSRPDKLLPAYRCWAQSVRRHGRLARLSGRPGECIHTLTRRPTVCRYTLPACMDRLASALLHRALRSNLPRRAISSIREPAGRVIDSRSLGATKLEVAAVKTLGQHEEASLASGCFRPR